MSEYYQEAIDEITKNLTEMGQTIVWENGTPYSVVGSEKMDISVAYQYPHKLDLSKIIAGHKQRLVENCGIPHSILMADEYNYHNNKNRF